MKQVTKYETNCGIICDTEEEALAYENIMKFNSWFDIAAPTLNINGITFLIWCKQHKGKLVTMLSNLDNITEHKLKELLND
jgi:hypothetical protein